MYDEYTEHLSTNAGKCSKYKEIHLVHTTFFPNDIPYFSKYPPYFPNDVPYLPLMTYHIFLITCHMFLIAYHIFAMTPYFPKR